MNRKKVLFVCIHNSARSQMAEAFLNQLGSDLFIAESAGLFPGQVNPAIVVALKEIGIDISHKFTQTVQQVLQSGKQFDYVITVCDQASSELCPVFPGKATQRLHWGFRDPTACMGTAIDRMNFTREIRDEIKAKIQQFVLENRKK